MVERVHLAVVKQGVQEEQEVKVEAELQEAQEVQQIQDNKIMALPDLLEQEEMEAVVLAVVLAATNVLVIMPD
jgi:CO dehydrogenase/acetyl-CoA synthase beta subunit